MNLLVLIKVQVHLTLFTKKVEEFIKWQKGKRNIKFLLTNLPLSAKKYFIFHRRSTMDILPGTRHLPKTELR